MADSVTMAPSHDVGPAMAPSHDVGALFTNLVTRLGQIVTVAPGAADSLGTFTIAVKNNTIALGDNSTALGKNADETARLDAGKLKLAADEAFAKDQAAGHTRAVTDNSKAMQSAAYDAHVMGAAMQGMAADTADGIAVMGTGASSAAMVISAASAQATAALTDLLKVQNLYTASLQNTLSVATDWGNYLANLVQAYQDGSTSLLAYKIALEDFLKTLETGFATATGKAKTALDEMIATVQKLIDTAGAGPAPTTDNSYGGALNKAFGP